VLTHNAHDLVGVRAFLKGVVDEVPVGRGLISDGWMRRDKCSILAAVVDLGLEPSLGVGSSRLSADIRMSKFSVDVDEVEEVRGSDAELSFEGEEEVKMGLPILVQFVSCGVIF